MSSCSLSSQPSAGRRRSAPRNRRALLAVLFAAFSLGGCQGTPGPLAGEDYPPEYAEGFRTGCASGRQAAGALAQFRKDVPRYMSQPLYAEGWDDGYRQCQALQANRAGLDSWRSTALERERDREWRRHIDQARAQALRH